MNVLPSFKPVRRSRLRAANSLVEMLIVVGVMAVLVGAWALPRITTTRTAVVDTKLNSDVARLNTLVSLYLASGGSLAGATTPQQIIDRLKTKRADADAKRTVFPMTGRAVDTRLSVRAQSSTEAASASPRAVWN